MVTMLFPTLFLMTGLLSAQAGLEDLYKPQPGVARRISSFSADGSNVDYLVVKQGETRTIADISGSGIIRHIWMTGTSQDPNYLRNTVIRFYWDGEQNPSVNVPLGDLFGMGHGVMTDFDSIPISVMRSPHVRGTGVGGMNLYFPMPFSRRARIEVENQSAQEIPALFFHVDYDQVAVPAADRLRFHAVWHAERLTTAKGVKPPSATYSDRESWLANKHASDEGNFVVLDAKGEGHLVGCVFSIDSRAPDPVKWWEGDEMISIDDDTWPPRIHGTGTEDYFGVAYGFRAVNMRPYLGISFVDKRPETDTAFYHGRFTGYRFHIPDPITFRKRIKFSFEHGHANDSVVRFTSTAYWYQTEPHQPQPALPEPQNRMWKD